MNGLNFQRFYKYFKVLFGLLYFNCISNSLLSQKAEFFKIEFRIDEETSATVIHQIKQDSIGFIWLATDKGIVRFDGERFVQFDLSKVSKSNEFFGITKDNNGKLWFFDSNRALFTYNYQKQRFDANPYNELLIHQIVGIPQYYFWYKDTLYHESINKRIWKLFSIDGVPKTYPIYPEKHSQSIIYKDQSIHFSEIKFDEIKEEIRYSHENNFKIDFLKAKAGTHNRNQVWSNDSVTIIYHLDDLIWTKDNNAPLSFKIFGEATANGLYATSNSELWLGLFNDGLLRINLIESTNDITIDTVIKSGTITSISSDMTGDGLWISDLSAKFYYIPNIKDRVFFHNTEIRQIEPLDQLLFVAQRNGSVYSKLGTDWSDFKLNTDLDLEVTWSRNYTDSVIFSNGLKTAVFRNNEYPEKQTVSDANFPNPTAINTFSQRTAYYKLNTIFSDSVEIITSDNTRKVHWPLVNRGLKQIFSNRAGDIFSTSFHPFGILLRKEENEIITLKEPNVNFSIGRVRDVFISKSDDFIIVNQNGIYKLNVDDYKKLDTFFFTLDFEINKCRIINSDTLLCTNKGVKKLQSSKYISFVDLPINHKTLNVFDFLETESLFWISTSTGLFRLDKSSYLIGKNKTQKPHIYSYSLNGSESLQLDSENVFEHDNLNLEIFWFPSTFSRTVKSLYRYRLNEFEAWNELRANSAIFQSLNSGNYKFEVQCQNLEGSWSESSFLYFKVLPPWYLSPIFLVILSLTIGLIIYVIFNLRYNNLKEKLSLREAALNAQNQALGTQLNPHFIFNSMNTVSSFIAQEDDTKALRYISKLSIMLRRIFTNAQKPTISLSEEILSVHEYIDIEQLRFGDKLKFHYENNSSSNLDDIQIPSMIIQPFVENAIKHAILKNEFGGNIWLQIKDEENSIQVIIEDDGPGFTEENVNSRNSTGESSISAIKKRLEIIKSLKQEGATLTFSNGNKGAKVILAFQLKF